MDIKLVNRIRRKYLKTLIKLNKKIENEKCSPELLINYLNQIYFINNSLRQVEKDIKSLNNCIETDKKKNQKKKIKKDNKKIREEQIIDNSIEAFKPYIFAHYLLSQTIEETYS